MAEIKQKSAHLKSKSKILKPSKPIVYKMTARRALYEAGLRDPSSLPRRIPRLLAVADSVETTPEPPSSPLSTKSVSPVSPSPEAAHSGPNTPAQPAVNQPPPSRSAAALAAASTTSGSPAALPKKKNRPVKDIAFGPGQKVCAKCRCVLPVEDFPVVSEEWRKRMRLAVDARYASCSKCR